MNREPNDIDVLTVLTRQALPSRLFNLLVANNRTQIFGNTKKYFRTDAYCIDVTLYDSYILDFRTCSNR